MKQADYETSEYLKNGKRDKWKMKPLENETMENEMNIKLN